MREIGYYWVKTKGGWKVAFWSEQEEWIINTNRYSDLEFEEIDENRILSPDEE